MHTIASLGGVGASFRFRFDLLGLKLGFEYCLAGRALIIPAQEDMIVDRNNQSCKTCSIGGEGIMFQRTLTGSEKRPAVSLPWGKCVGMGDE